MAESIENHAVIGDMRTAALVALDGTIDFLCWPAFESPSVFASLLDDERGGSFELAPVLDHVRHRQLYLPDTNVLLTRFLSPHGVAEISDFMPIGTAGAPQRLVRRVKAVRRTMRMRLRCAPRFDYARAGTRVQEDGGTVVFTSDGADGTSLRLRATVPLRIDGDAAIAEFDLEVGSFAAFVLEDAALGVGCDSADPDFVSASFKSTLDAWRLWVANSTYRGRWRDIVNRSALTLKLLTSQAQGTVVAAATFGLPETIGGSRNWDYRYPWLRDAAFTISAFLKLGHTGEARAFMRWLGERTAGAGASGALHLMYGIDGRSRLPEQELPHLAGYRDSRPVRIGNAASEQLQLDIHGELLDAIYLADKYVEPIYHEAWERVAQECDWLCDNWRTPDQSIWEVRGPAREFLHSRLMCWVAFDRAIRLAFKRSLPASIARWAEVRDTIHRDIHANFWDAARQTFVQAKGSDALDASCLLMPLVGFIGPTDPRWLSTLSAIGKELMDDSLVYRYSNRRDLEGLDGFEGTFNMCTFWYVECLARSGDVAQARFHFEKMLGYANHVGLFAEELGPTGEHLGNFPQAFTHLALISAAHYLDSVM